MWTFCTLLRHSMAQYPEFEKYFAGMMTVRVVWGHRGFAMYVERCQNRALYNQKFCVQVLICLQYGQICCRDNCSEITIVTWGLLVSGTKSNWRFKMARNVEKLWAMLLIWCYAWCLVISKTWSLIVFKFNETVQAIVCVFCDIIFLKI